LQLRVRATRAPDGSYEVRTIDMAMRTPLGDALVPAGAGGGQTRMLLAPDVRLDSEGNFAGLLDPGALEEFFDRIIQRRVAEPEAGSAEAERRRREPDARTQAAAYVESRARQPWEETVGHWAGKRVELGRTYRSTGTLDGTVFMARPAQNYRVEKVWSAIGRESCTTVDAMAATPNATSARGATDCLRLSLKTAYVEVKDKEPRPEEGGPAFGTIRIESEVTVLAEPAALRPHEVVRILGFAREGAGQPPERNVVESTTSRWIYGPRALQALQSSIDVTKLPLTDFRSRPGEPPPPAAKTWPPQTPERAVADYLELITSADRSAATQLLHPDLLRRAATRFRGPQGIRGSDANRKTLVGESVTVEQVDAMSDEALYSLVVNHAVASGRDRVPRLMTSLGAGEVIGHAADEAGRAHVVVHSRVTQLPEEVRFNSQTIVAARLPEPAPSRPASPTSASTSTCDRKRDRHGCWRIWLDPSVEYGFLIPFPSGPSVNGGPPPEFMAVPPPAMTPPPSKRP